MPTGKKNCNYIQIKELLEKLHTGMVTRQIQLFLCLDDYSKKNYYFCRCGTRPQPMRRGIWGGIWLFVRFQQWFEICLYVALPRRNAGDLFSLPCPTLPVSVACSTPAAICRVYGRQPFAFRLPVSSLPGQANPSQP